MKVLIAGGGWADCAAAGVIIGIVVLTGLGLAFSQTLVSVAGEVRLFYLSSVPSGRSSSAWA